MFSPSTTAAIVAIANRHNSNMCTSPRLQHAASLSHGGASSQGLPSGGTTESRRGGGITPPLHPLQPDACPLLQWDGKHL